MWTGRNQDRTHWLDFIARIMNFLDFIELSIFSSYNYKASVFSYTFPATSRFNLSLSGSQEICIDASGSFSV